MIGPTLSTERLILRPPSREDWPAWAAFMADPQAMRHLGGPQPASIAWRGFSAMTGCWVLQGFSMFTVLQRSTGRWMGRLGPWRPEGWPGPEIGWGLACEFHGQGYAKEGATAAIDWAFDTLGWEEVIHVIEPGNAPSVKLAEALGSTPRGQTRMPPPFDALPCAAWGQTRTQWKARATREGR